MSTTEREMPRLSAFVHTLCANALAGDWGRSLVDLPLTLDNQPELEGAPDELRYAHCIRLVAEQAPLRILPGEPLVGSSTLQQATYHNVPVYAKGKPAYRSTSHVTPGFARALAIGYAGLGREIEERLDRGDLDERGRTLLQAMTICLDAARTWHRRHLEALDERIADAQGEARAHYQRVRDNLAPVPENPPETFYQALQALWFLFSFQRLCGNWPGIGRIDEMLGRYLQRDLAAGHLTLDEARELLAHFWIKGCDWVGSANWSTGSSGDGQFYQNIVLSGVDAEGEDVTNEVTYLVLDVVEELRISDFPIAVRIGPGSPERLLRRIAEVQRRGTGTVAVYNEPLILRSLQAFGYSLEEARRFANDGCWEIQVPGKTCFAYRPFDTLAILQRVLGVTGDDPIKDYVDLDSLYRAYHEALARQIDAIQADGDRHGNSGYPSTLISLLTEDCIERGRGYYERGARYNVYSPHAGGLPNVGNSLLAIKRIVYDEGRLTLNQFVACLRGDWQGQEPLRREILNQAFYGNDDPEADAMVRRVFNDFIDLVERVHEREGVLRPAGVSTFGREIEWRPQRQASADGHHAGEILATNLSPSPGTDKKGPTAVIKSHCSLGLERLTNGTALELKMHPSLVAGEEGVTSLVALLRSFVDLGGIFMHVDVVDNASLRDAQAHPEKYPTLAVRVSGWSARFVTLSKEWQEMIINRTQQV